MSNRKSGVAAQKHRELRHAVLLTLVISLALLAAQPASAQGKPSFPAASHLCDRQGGVFSSVDGLVYACSGLNPLEEPTGMYATTPLCEGASRGSYMAFTGGYMCWL